MFMVLNVTDEVPLILTRPEAAALCGRTPADFEVSGGGATPSQDDGLDEFERSERDNARSA
jgi:hypothetical protein